MLIIGQNIGLQLIIKKFDQQIAALTNSFKEQITAQLENTQNPRTLKSLRASSSFLAILLASHSSHNVSAFAELVGQAKRA